MNRRFFAGSCLCIGVLASALACSTPVDTVSLSRPEESVTLVECDVIVNGGSLAALAAGLHAAREGALTCLIEPTDVPGGQMTSEGVSAPDFAGHRVGNLNVGFLSRHSSNQAPELAAWLRSLGNVGRCWVSSWCFPTPSILGVFVGAIARESRLRVFSRSVVVSIEFTDQSPDRLISSVVAVQRSPDDPSRPTSDMVQRWYDPAPSAEYPDKQTLRFRGRDGHTPVVIEASPFGDLLVLSGSDWLQGADATDGGTVTGDDRCGMALTFPFVLEYRPELVHVSGSGLGSLEVATPSKYSLVGYGWDRVWTYRRLISTREGPTPGDLSLQIWNPGNDYVEDYHLASMTDASREVSQGWRGGVRPEVLRAAEERALDFARWFYLQAPDSVRPHLRLSRTWATQTGLARMPYLRDSRRAIGLDGFVLPGSSFSGSEAQRTGTVYYDRVAIGAYQFDFRLLRGCAVPFYANVSPWTLPYYIPFRALTHRDVGNLLVAGKNMAQSTLANTATRLHPTEWHSGIAAGVAGAWMAESGMTSKQALGNIGEIQARIRRWAPLDWNLVQP